MLEASLPLWRKAMPPGHVFLLEELYFLSFAYTEAGRWRDAEPIAREGLQIAEAQVPSIGKRLARMHFMLGRALAGQTKYREAFAHLQAAEAIFSQHLDIPLARDEAARVRVALDEVRSKLGR
jgi:tetratricopeptide (TPR) repeat protein